MTPHWQAFLFKTKIKNMIKCPFHVEQRLFLKLPTPSFSLLPRLRVNRSKKRGATLYSSFEAFCNWTHLIDIPQAHNYNAQRIKMKHIPLSQPRHFTSFFLMNENLMKNKSEMVREVKLARHFS